MLNQYKFCCWNHHHCRLTMLKDKGIFCLWKCLSICHDKNFIKTSSSFVDHTWYWCTSCEKCQKMYVILCTFCVHVQNHHKLKNKYNFLDLFYTLNPNGTLKIEPRSPKVDTCETLSMITIYLNLKAKLVIYFWKYCGQKEHFENWAIKSHQKLLCLGFCAVTIIAKSESHLWKTFGNIVDTSVKCNIFTC